MYFLFSIAIGIILFSLYKRTGRLEDRIDVLERQLRGGPVVAERPLAAVADVSRVKSSEEVHEESEPDARGTFIHWISVDWPMKLGAFLILLGFGWLTTYAFLNDWIGPTGRILLGMVGGVGIMVLGNWRVVRFRAQGAVLIGLGAAIFLVTTFAAREMYDFFTPLVALGMMAFIAFFVGIAAWKHESLSLGVIGLVAGGVSPLLTNASEPSFTGLFSYLFVLSLGIIWLASVRGWRILIFLSWLLAFLYSTPYFVMGVSDADTPLAILFAGLFGALFYGIGMSAMIRSDERRSADLLTAGANALFLLLWIMAAIPDVLQSLTATGVALAFAVGAFILFRATSLRSLFYIYASVAVGMLAAATAFELEGPALTIAYTIEAGIVSLLAAYVLNDYKLATKVGLLLGIPVLFSGESIGSYAWERGVFHGDFFVLLVLSGTLLTLGWVFLDARKTLHPEIAKGFVRLYITFGSIYWFILLWLSIHAWIISQTTARMTTLIVYTIFGIGFYIVGMQKAIRGMQLTGEILFGVVVADLLFVEVWHMTIAGKIVTFLLIGTLLTSTIFLRKSETKKEITDHEKNI